MPTLSLDADLRLHLQRFPEAGLLELRLQHLKGRTVCVSLRRSDAFAVSQALRTGTKHAVLNAAAEGLLIQPRSGHWQAELELRGPGGVMQIGLSVAEAEQLAQCLAG
jgi:hypothetical protein